VSSCNQIYLPIFSEPLRHKFVFFSKGYDFEDELELSGLNWFQVDIQLHVNCGIVLELNKQLVCHAEYSAQCNRCVDSSSCINMQSQLISSTHLCISWSHRIAKLFNRIGLWYNCLQVWLRSNPGIKIRSTHINDGPNKTTKWQFSLLCKLIPLK